MATKLAIKHKDSLVLKESKLLHKDKCETRKQSKLKRCKHFSLLWLMSSMFLAYWLILCPLIWAVCYVSRTHWPSYWPSFFWTIAFLIWIMVTCVLMISWRYLQVKQNDEINVISRYGSENVAEKPISTHQTTVSTEDTKFPNTNRMNDISDKTDSKSKNCRGNFRRKDLPPLVIHKRMSGEEIEDTGVVHVEKDAKAQLNVASDYVEKSPLQDYLKLVTVSPSEDEIKSPKTPMSPRELFFIDLIREAEKAESAQSLKTKGYFFPSEAIENDTRIMKDIKNQKEEGSDTKDKEDPKDEKNTKTSGEESKHESCYFIADVDSPVSEKTEVFLQIDPSVSEQVELIVEKPV